MASPSHTLPVRPTTLFRQAREPIFLLNAGKRLVYVNPAWESLTGLSAAEALGLECVPLAPTRPGDASSLASAFAPPSEAMSGRPASVSALIDRADGQRLWRRVEFWPHHDEQGQLVFVIGLVQPADADPHAAEAESRRLHVELQRLRDRLLSQHGIDHLIGQGPAHRRLLDQIQVAADRIGPVLIAGPPGAGKRLVARTIHQRGSWSTAPFLPFDCEALPPDVLERELFGSEAAHLLPQSELPVGTTILLGDVLNLPRDVQQRLAHALDGQVRFRFLALTSSDPDQALADDRLRPDLYYALTTLVIRLPALRARLEEIPLLAQHLLERTNLKSARRREGFQREAIDALLAYDWPGNVRELLRVVEVAHGQGDGDLIGATDLPASIRGHLGAAYLPPPMPRDLPPLDETLERLERHLIEHALQRARQNKSQAAKLLHISRPRLHRRINELKIPEVPEPQDNGSAPATKPTPGV